MFDALELAASLDALKVAAAVDALESAAIVAEVDKTLKATATSYFGAEPNDCVKCFFFSCPEQL